MHYIGVSSIIASCFPHLCMFLQVDGGVEVQGSVTGNRICSSVASLLNTGKQLNHFGYTSQELLS